MNLGKSHYTGLHTHASISPENIAEFKEIIKDENCDIFNYLSPTRRVGSESLHAVVQETVFSKDKLNMVFAVKVLADDEKSTNEINLSMYLSSNWPGYFLKTYGYVNCKEINFGSRISSGIFMFMEFALTDLGQLLISNYVLPRDLLRYIDEVLDSIYTLGILHIFHGDLHVRNVFIVNSDCDKKAVIGDFGESMTGTNGPYSEAHLSDMVKFFSSLEELLRTVNNAKSYVNIRMKLLAAMRKANQLTREAENKYENWCENHYDGKTELVDFTDVDDFFKDLVGENIAYIREYFQEDEFS